MTRATNSRVLRVIPLLFISAMFCPFARAKVIYVDNDAAGAGDGASWTDAYNRVQDGINAASDGDTVLVGPGTYVENINFNGKNIVVGSLMLTTGDTSYIRQTIIDGSQPANPYEGSVVYLISGEDSATVLNGFTITGGSGTIEEEHPFDHSFGGGIFLDNNSCPSLVNLIITGNVAQNAVGAGICCWNNNNCRIENVIVAGNDGLGSTWTNDGAGGVYLANSSPVLRNVVIANNTGLLAGGMFCNEGSNPVLINVTIAGNTAFGSVNNEEVAEFISWQDSNPVLINSIIWNDFLPEIIVRDNAVTISYSDVQGGLDGIVLHNDARFSNATVNWLEGNIDSEPMFVDPVNVDYRLRVGSPCIDAGDNSALPLSRFAVDLDGNPRVVNGTVDMGAYEGGVAPSANILYVDADAAGASDGTSWADAYTCLQDALAVASRGDEIHVAQGTYRPDRCFSTGRSPGMTASGDRTATFHLINGVAIKGGYAGVGEPDPDAREVALYETVLSGDLSGNDKPNFINSAENSYHVVTGSGTNGTAVLEGFTIVAGNADGPVPYERGGGMYNGQSHPTVITCTFSRNRGDFGGAIYNDHGNPTLANCTFSGNSAEKKGGGIYSDGGNLTLLNCLFIENTSVSNGAAVKLISSDATINGCRFQENMTLGGGSANAGAIGNSKSSPTITDCTFVNNSCPGFSGGAMVNYTGSNPTVFDCVFQGNSAGAGGGGIFNWVSSSPLVVNCIFVGNSANRGGGMSNNKDCHPTVINCTFVGNSARDTGGGMWSRTGSSAGLSNCILWENTGDDGKNTGESAQIDSDGTSTVAVNHCDIQGLTGALGGTGNIGDPPLFVDADGADNVIGTEDDDLRLLPGSPCIDAGDNSTVPAFVDVDGDGNPRIINGVVDMGAYEGGVAPSANILYVDADAAGANDGTSWADAYTCLQDALAVASSGDEIHVAQGTYRPDQYFSTGRFPGIAASGDRTAAFHLINGVAIKGGYAGLGEPDPDARSIDLYRAVLSGDLSGNDRPNFINNAENSYHVVTGSGTNETAVLEGFTITAGHANGPALYDRGGGMLNDQGSPTVIDCTFTGNFSDTAGAMNNANGSPTLTHCTFSDNSADKGGGAVTNWQSSPTLTHCTFENNSAAWAGGAMDNHNNITESSPTLNYCTFIGNSAGWDGGGVSNWQSSPTLTNCVFSENSADEGGGGMHNSDGSHPYITNCMFSGNSSSFGGGMYNEFDSRPAITDCTFSGNSAERHGGGMSNDTGSPTLLNCTFVENLATGGGGMSNIHESCPTVMDCTFSSNLAGDNGGGMRNNNSSPTVTNCTFRGNSAKGHGGGMSNFSGSPNVTNCTFTGNGSNRNGGGMRNSRDSDPNLTNCTFRGNSARNGGGVYNSDNSSPTVTNCVLWDDTPQEIHTSDGTLVITYSDVQGGWPGTGNIDANPLFVDTDGADGVIGTEDDDLRLLPGSPCIDTGDNSSVPAFIDVDRDGNLRIINGVVDMGAYEHSPTSQYLKAGNPSPTDGDLHAYPWVNLRWRRGNLAVSHDVYFGESFDDVNDGAEGTFRGNQAETLFVVGLPGYPYPRGLVPNTTYYWRIDAVNDLHPDSPWKGDVWRFSIPSETDYIPRHFEITYYDNYNYDTDEWDAWQSAETPLDAWDDKYAPIDPAKTAFTDHAFTSIETFDLRGDLFSKDGHASVGEDWNPLQSIGDDVSGQSAHHVFAAVFKGLIYLEEGDILWVASDDDVYVFLDDDTAWGQEVLSVPYISRFGTDSMIVTAAQAGYRLMTVKYMERRNIRSGIEITLNGEPLRSAEVGHVLTVPGRAQAGHCFAFGYG